METENRITERHTYAEHSIAERSNFDCTSRMLSNQIRRDVGAGFDRILRARNGFLPENMEFQAGRNP